MKILGVDPGQSGALALYDTANPHRVIVEDMPTVGKDVDAATLARLVLKWEPDAAIIEAVHSMPKQGVASSFKFGRSYGIALGVVAAIRVPSHHIAPTSWKRYFRLTSDKEMSRAAALNLFPEDAAVFRRKKDADRAEAALLAKYGAEVVLVRMIEAAA